MIVIPPHMLIKSAIILSITEESPGKYVAEVALDGAVSVFHVHIGENDAFKVEEHDYYVFARRSLHLGKWFHQIMREFHHGKRRTLPFNLHDMLSESP